ncbi:MAG: methyltransferase [Micromonosporaceae bacterium]
MASNDEQMGAPRAGGADRAGFAHRKLLGVLSGSWLAQACYAVVKVGVPDLLAEGPRTVDDLAAASGADAGALYRLLRALAASGIFRQPAGRTFAHNPVSELLRTDAAGSAYLIALMHGEEVFRSFAEIMHTVRTGGPAFEQVYGTTFYRYLDANPEAARTFNQAMGDQGVLPSLSTCDFTGVDTLVDVGGGDGALLVDVLTTHPRMRAVLFERPDALQRARARLAGADLADRVEFVEGDFFDSVPAGGDAYVLARVLHNWTDEHAVELLRRVHTAMRPGARLFVLENLLPEVGEPAAGAGLGDLLMLVTLEGRDRTDGEYRELLVKAGFSVLALRRAAGQPTSAVIEAIPT